MKPNAEERVDEQAFGIVAMFKVAVPLVVSVSCFAFTLFTDRTLLLWYDAESSGASVAAGNVYWTVACLPVTAMGFVTPLVAQAFAGARTREISNLVVQSVWITLATCPLFLVLALFATRLFLFFGHEDSLAVDESIYFRILLTVAPGSMLEAGLSAYFVGRRVIKPVMHANLLSALANVVLDVWLIFGGLGIESMGIAGAAIATSLSLWLKVVIYAALIVKDHPGNVDIRPDRPTIVRILGPGSTLGLQQLIRSFVFSSVLIAIGAASVQGLAASSAALSIYQLLTIPLIGLASAVTVLTSQAMASGGRTLAAISIRSAFALSLPYASLVSAAMLLAPVAVLSLSTGGMKPEQASEIIPLASMILPITGAYCIAETLFLIAGAVLKALGRTFIILVATILSSVLCIGVGRVFIVGRPAMGENHEVLTWWAVLVAWAVCQAAVLGIAVYHETAQRLPKYLGASIIRKTRT